MTDLQAALDEFVKSRRGGGIIPAKVTGVDAAALTCDVVDADGNTIYDVRLRATVDNEDDGKYYLPKVGAWVLIGQIGHQENAWAVVMWSDITVFRWDVRPVVFRVDETGFLLEKASDTLADMVADLVDELKALSDALQILTVTCAAPGSPSTPPINAASFVTASAALTALKTRFNNILKTA